MCKKTYHIQNTKPPKQHHAKKTVNVKVYQNTNTSIYYGQELGGRWKYRLGTASDT